MSDNQPETRMLFVDGIVCRRGFESPESIWEFISIEGEASHSLGRTAQIQCKISRIKSRSLHQSTLTPQLEIPAKLKAYSEE
jgi:hypothetical protein